MKVTIKSSLFSSFFNLNFFLVFFFLIEISLFIQGRVVGHFCFVFKT